jgi:Zn-dependent peptidase ImmA (M78 family)
MRNSQAYSEPQSEIVRLFVERCGVAPAQGSPEQAMTELVERTAPRKHVRSQGQRVQCFLDARKVVSVEFVPDAGYDGMIEPIGSTFSEGFRMRLKTSASDVRARFTVAHEACHTFFYELAPEVKFHPHEEDDHEESLCNFGAAVLLIPAASLCARTRKLTICLDSLEQLAQEYAVSLPTMLLRLRSLGLWKCQLSLWHRTASGEFVLDRLYGGRNVEWKWQDASVLERVWESNESVFETGFVYAEGRGGTKAYKPISYHVQRSGLGVTVLWGKGIRPTVSTYPLFKIAQAA